MGFTEINGIIHGIVIFNKFPAIRKSFLLLPQICQMNSGLPHDLFAVVLILQKHIRLIRLLSLDLNFSRFNGKWAISETKISCIVQTILRQLAFKSLSLSLQSLIWLLAITNIAGYIKELTISSNFFSYLLVIQFIMKKRLRSHFIVFNAKFILQWPDKF